MRMMSNWGSKSGSGHGGRSRFRFMAMLVSFNRKIDLPLTRGWVYLQKKGGNTRDSVCGQGPGIGRHSIKLSAFKERGV